MTGVICAEIVARMDDAGTVVFSICCSLAGHSEGPVYLCPLVRICNICNIRYGE